MLVVGSIIALLAEIGKSNRLNLTWIRRYAGWKGNERANTSGEQATTIQNSRAEPVDIPLQETYNRVAADLKEFGKDTWGDCTGSSKRRHYRVTRRGDRAKN